MSAYKLFRLFRRYLWAFLVIPIALAGSVYFFTRFLDPDFATDTLIYTGLASGSSLDGEGNRMDYQTINNAFDNLINTIEARTTLEEVGIRLLAEHMMLKKPNPAVANERTFERLHKDIPESVFKQLVNDNSLEATVKNIYKYSVIPRNVIGEELLNEKKSFYSVEGINKNLKVSREGTSDMIRMEYVASDPAVVKRSLELMSEIFIRRQKELKSTQSGSVVAYFEKQLQDAFNKLSQSENDLKNFSSQNRIINYYEQTRMFADQDKTITNEIEKARAELEASKAALSQLDQKLNMREDLVLKSDDVRSVRDSLAILNTRLTFFDLQPNPDPIKRQALTQQIKQFEQKARKDIGQLYQINNSTKGIPTKSIFDQWLEYFVSVDRNQARVTVLENIKQGYDSSYQRFAPLGSNLGKLERGISVAEREYLEILHGLSLSKLREQNLLLSSSNLKIIDPPKFPAKPEPSKRIIMIIGAAFLGLILVATWIFAREYFDQSLKSPKRALDEIRLPLVGICPQHRSFRSNMERVEDIAINQCLAKLAAMTGHMLNRPLSILVTSTREHTGKSYFIEKMQNALAALPENQRPQFYFLEIPALLNHPTPSHLIKDADVTIFVADAKERWLPVDRHVVNTYLLNMTHTAGFVLNRVGPDELGEMTGKVD